MQTILMNLLLVVSCFLLIPPFTMLGVGGLAGYWILSIVFRVGDEAVEQMAEEIQQGNEKAGCAWLIVIFIFVIIGGTAALGVLFEVASLGRGL